MTKSGKKSGFNRLSKSQILEEKSRLEKKGIRLDVETGQLYNDGNIPMGRICACKISGKVYKIFAQNGTDDVWHNGKFIGDNYAVFVEANGFWQQVSPWYSRYGNAERYMTHNFD